MPSEGAGAGDPGQLLGEDFARRVGVDERLDAQAWARVSRIGESAEDDVKAPRGLLHRSFGEPRDVEKALCDRGTPGCVQHRGRSGLVGGDGGTGIEFGAGADRNLDVVKGTFGLNDTMPTKRGAGFGEGRHLVGQLAAVDAGLESGDGVAVKNGADQEIKDERGERERSAEPAARTFATRADFFGDETAEEREEDSREEDSQDPEVERRKPVHHNAAGGERPKEFDTVGLASIEDKMTEGCDKRG